MRFGSLEIERFELGPFATNCYFVTDNVTACIVDASFDPTALVKHGKREQAFVSDIVLTHAHCDHIAGLDDVRRAWPKAKLTVHALETAWLEDPMLNLSASYGEPISVAPADATVRGGEELALAGRKWKVLHVPGHSPGSIALYSALDGVVISGDALFAGSIGRTDFPSASFETLAESIRTQLYTLPEDTVVLPGHGPATTIGKELRGNPFVRL